MGTNFSPTGEDASFSPALIQVKEGVWAIPEDNRPLRTFNENGVEVKSFVASSSADTFLGEEPNSKNGEPKVPALMFIEGVMRKGLDRVLGPVVLPKEISSDADAGDFSGISLWQRWRLGMKDTNK